MMWRLTCLLGLAGVALGISSCTSCGKEQTPDQIRQETANATAKIKRDGIAVAQGVKDGITRPKTIDINSAPKSELTSLPGVNDAIADRIINARPYDNPDQLVTKRAVTTEEYDKIKDRVVVKK